MIWTPALRLLVACSFALVFGADAATYSDWSPAEPQGAETRPVGEVHFANSGSSAAQAPFLNGLALLHNFEYGAAAASFRRAQELDPGFVMAYWGEAMTYNHPVWMQQDRDAGSSALHRLGATRQARLALAKTPREKAYLNAVEVLFGEGDKDSRDFEYADAMAALHRAYPEDIDATAFYALALLGTAHQGRDFATYMRAAALLEPVFQEHPNHPGLAHYLIHCYDDPIHAPLGLRAARAYSRIAPESGHAQHMCSHIFVALGLWDDVVHANEAAASVVARQMQARGRSAPACGHYQFWLEYGYLQQGRMNDAKRVLDGCRVQAAASRPLGTNAPIDPDNSAAGSFAAMRARFLFDTEQWRGEVLSWRIPRGQHPADITIEFVDAFAAARTGRVGDAQQALEAFKADRAAVEAALDGGHDAAVEERGRLAVLELELNSVLAGAQSKRREATNFARAAAEAEERLPFEFGPPFIDKPSYELLGETLAAENDASGARAAFEKALARTPERVLSLKGLLRAAEAMGDRRKADEVRSRLAVILHAADDRAKTFD